MGTYTYNGSHPHAVASTSANNWSFQYDANGNMTTRNAGNIYTLSYDAENRVTAVSGGGISASFVYDGDGNRVQATVSGVTTTFVGAYEWTANGNTLYYSVGGARLAMRRTGYASDNGLFWILGDHLGSTSIVANADGSLKSRLLYKAWGEVRYSTGVANTKYTFTGQYQHVSDFGLMYYVARWYDPALGRFAEADSVVYTGAQGLDRYAYTKNNPVRYTDPSGHIAKDCDGMGNCTTDPFWRYDKGGNKEQGDCNDPNGLWIEDGKICHWVKLTNTWNVSLYFTPVKEEYSGGDTEIRICNNAGDNCYSTSLPGEFVYLAWYNGEGKFSYSGVNDYIHFDSDIVEGSQTIHMFHPGRNHTIKGEPYRDAAVGDSFRGGEYLIPELSRYDINTRFNGIDSGGEILDNEIDIYIGTGKKAYGNAWEDDVRYSIDSATVYQKVCVKIE